MNHCPAAASLHSYVDGELSTADALSLEAHLMDCGACRERYESLLSVVGSVRAAHPLYTAPPDSYRRAERQILAQRRRELASRAGLAASLLVAAATGWLLYTQPGRALNPFAAYAAETHLRYTRGALPLDVTSGDAHAVAEWLQQRLPFHVTLPSSAEPPGKVDYSIVGARLLEFHDQPSGYVAYRVGRRAVSLLITASPQVLPAGEKSQKIGRLIFYATSHGGLEAISWLDQGLGYALVAEPGAPAGEPCVVCHSGPAERRKFAPLRLPI